MSSANEVTPEIARFRQSPAYREELAAILRQPTMAEAIKAVLTLAIPRGVPPHVPGVHHDTVIAHQFHHGLGVVQVVNMLNFMTTDGGPMGNLLSPDEEEFTHDLAPELREMPADLKARQQ